MSDGQELEAAATRCFREVASRRKSRNVYKGFEWNVAVSRAMEQGNIHSGKRKDRRAAAEQVVTVLFDKARASTADRLDKVAACVGPDGARAASPEQSTDLEVFAREVCESLTALDAHDRKMGVPDSDLVSGVVDIGAIVQLIMTIINAIRACRTPAPA